MKPIDQRIRETEAEQLDVYLKMSDEFFNSDETITNKFKVLEHEHGLIGARIQTLNSLRTDLIAEAKELNEWLGDNQDELDAIELEAKEYLNKRVYDKSIQLSHERIKLQAELSRIAKTIYEGDNPLEKLMEEIK